MSVEYVGKGSPDGTVLGRSGEKIGFFGLATPIVQPSVTAVTTTTATTTLNETRLSRLESALTSLNLINTGG